MSSVFRYEINKFSRLGTLSGLLSISNNNNNNNNKIIILLKQNYTIQLVK